MVNSFDDRDAIGVIAITPERGDQPGLISADTPPYRGVTHIAIIFWACEDNYRLHLSFWRPAPLWPATEIP